MMKFTGFVLGAALASAGISAAFAEETSVETVIASVNGVDITLGHVIAFQELLPEQYQKLEDPVLYNGIVEQLIQQQILATEFDANPSRRNLLGLANEGRAFRASSKLNELAKIEISEEALKAAYDGQYANAAPQAEYDASHILVETEEAAQELIGKITAGADFADLAREVSTGPSGPNGGALGWFGAGMMVKPFEDAVLEMQVGGVSAPVQTQFGWHVIRLNDKRIEDAPLLVDVREELLMELRTAAVEAEIARLTQAAVVSRSEVEIDPALMRNGALID